MMKPAFANFRVAVRDHASPGTISGPELWCGRMSYGGDAIAGPPQSSFGAKSERILIARMRE